MKYAKPVDYNDGGGKLRMTELVTIPVYAEADPVAWLNKQMVGIGGAAGFVQVHDDVKPCAFYNGGGYMTLGNFTQPVEVPPIVKYKVTLPQISVQSILLDVFGEDRLDAIDAATALLVNGWPNDRKKFNNPNRILSRKFVEDYLKAQRQADIPTQPTKISNAEITAIISDPRWVET